MRILLVEDDRPLGEGIRTALKPEGYTVDWLQDGASALHALSHESFDLAILDLGLPRLDGLEVLKRLRAAANAVPVLVLTARDATTDRIAGLDAGADDYLVKPFDVDELKARLRALLRRRFNRPEPTLEYRGIVLDPACGSGAFPMGILTKLFVALQKLDPDNRRWREQNLAPLQQRLAGRARVEPVRRVRQHVHRTRRGRPPLRRCLLSREL